MSQYVVWFDSSETGAPVLNNAAGSLIGVLDACLITGFNTKAVTITVAAGVATATANGHGFSGTYGKDVLIAGATPALLNGRKELTFVDTNTFRFAALGVADGAATGTITAKRDPLGWVKQFIGANKAIYKRSDVTATSMMLRVLDTAVAPAYEVEARVFMVETATDVDTYTGQSPPVTASQLGDGQYWNKGTSDTTAKQWTLIGDSKGFYLVTQSGSQVLPSATGYCSGVMGFGDFASLKAGDAYNCALFGMSSLGYGGGTGSGGGLGGGDSSLGAGTFNITVARAYSQLGGSIAAKSIALFNSPSGVVASSFVYPSPIDSGFLLSPLTPFCETVAGGYAARGFAPGYLQILGGNAIAHHEMLQPVVSLPGRRILGLAPYVQASCRIGIDMTGPWR